MRQIIVNETNTDLLYIYFHIYLIDGQTLANDLEGLQPEVNINNGGWTSQYIGVFEGAGYGYYRALLTSPAISTIGNIILSHYTSPSTTDSFGETIEIVKSLTQTAIFDDSTENITLNSYVTLPEAERYFATRFGSDAWDSAKQRDKLKSLVTATRDIDRLNFFGVKLSRTQILEFPRKKNHYPEFRPAIILGPTVDIIIENNSSEEENSSQIPDDIKIASCEIAIKYLEGVDIEEELNNMSVSSQRYSAVHETYSRYIVNEAYRAGINSSKAWIYLKSYLADPHQLRIAKI